MRNLFQLQKCSHKGRGGRYLIIIVSLFNDVTIDLVLLTLRFNEQISLQLGKKVKTMHY